jgi:hypothetical protein
VKPELFHATNDPPSAAARRRVVELGLESAIRFRNIFYAEVKADFAARGGVRLPALWDGQSLMEGELEVIRAIDELFARTSK